MHEPFRRFLAGELEAIRGAGLYKTERVITSSQNAWVTLRNGRRVLNLCANNYLGMASHPEVVEAARQALDQRGFGLSSVRSVCGTQDLHEALEHAISEFFGTEETMLCSSGFDANAGLFAALLGAEDAVICDQLNHASITDGVRLCKATRLTYPHSNMAGLEEQLQAAAKRRFRLIATSGVFPMDGDMADLGSICGLAGRYDAVIMIDDGDAAGFLGRTGRGTPEHWGVQGQIDVITGTLGKAFGGASGGYATGRREVIELLRQRSRPYLFSTALAPAIAAGSLKAFDLLSRSPQLRDALMNSARYFREALTDLGFDVPAGTHPITSVLLGDAMLAQRIAARLLEKAVYVASLSFPLVPRNQARVRTQVSAIHRPEDLDFALEKFEEVKNELGI
jgi:glycine C-acetyltransferase